MKAKPQPMKRLAAATIAALAPLAAWPAAGEFTFVVGEVALIKANGQRSVPARGTSVDPGDRITTGANGMAQLTMVDQARLSLRPQTQFVIEAYGDKPDSAQGGVLNLIKGTLRAFTGLIASTNRERFVMKTRVATVGIRGSGNILYACEDKECDESVAGPGGAQGAVAVNHTIDGSHEVTGVGPTTGAALVTGPGQTVLVGANLAPRFIPTPRFIADVAVNMTGAKDSAAPAGSSAETRNFSPSDTPALAWPQTQLLLVGNNGLGFPTIDASANTGADPLLLRDLVYVLGSPLYGQSLPADVVLDAGSVRSYRAYPGGVVSPTIVGGTAANNGGFEGDGATVSWGRWANAALSFGGGGSGTPINGSIHWINAPSGHPTYLSEVLTGSAVYTMVGNTNPTNQNNVVGSLGSANLNVNFTARTLDFSANVSMPASGPAGAASWGLAANNVPIALNSFYASTQDRLVITNNAGASSSSTNELSGSFQGAFVGNGLAMAILGYGISDATAESLANWHFVSGVAAFTGPPRNPGAEYREGRVSDVEGSLTQFVRTFATTNRPDEVVVNAQNQVTSFSAPYADFGPHATYSIGSAQVVDSGVDPDTGMVWGRWGGGAATVERAGQSRQVSLAERSLHYIFAGTQSGPVALPLTGTAAYDVIGSTRPTDVHGNVGTFNSAALNANFTAQTVDASVNFAIAGHTWNAQATGMPIYRNQYFSGYSGTPIAGLPNPAPVIITCNPNCGQGASGSFDGFFTGRSGGRAGMMYNIGGNQGAVAFGRRGG
jgi:hypothetical protein